MHQAEMNWVATTVAAVLVLILLRLLQRPKKRGASTIDASFFPPLCFSSFPGGGGSGKRGNIDPLQRRCSAKKLPRSADAIVIGGGASGLCTAALLCSQNREKFKHILVLEQHDRAGGGLHSFEEKGFEFDTGFHYSGDLRKDDALLMLVDSLTGSRVRFSSVEDCSVAPGVYDQVDFLCEDRGGAVERSIF
jgi:NAD(P)-binding Rossmann-like domain